MNATQQRQFEDFWSRYFKKVGKGAARKAFEKALKISSFESIMRGLESQRQYYLSKDPQFIPHASTWLNQERWSDEPQLPFIQNTRRTLTDAARDFGINHGDAQRTWDTSRH